PRPASDSPAPGASAGRAPAALPGTEKPRSITLHASPGMEIDLRGKRADEALDELERYLDAAFLAGMPFVRIIHGKGTGKLREAVRESLRHHHAVKSYEGGGDKEGGEGVTVAKLAA
ncbi:MAG: Smr/MutS family protein, partial [Chloroflexota bacterium]